MITRLKAHQLTDGEFQDMVYMEILPANSKPDARLMMPPGPVVQCSTGSLSPFGGGSYWSVPAVLRGIKTLGWPAVELRLWAEWGQPDFAEVARKVRGQGVAVHTVHAPPDTERILGCAGLKEHAMALLMRCAAGAEAAGARGIVVHAWDLRISGFHLPLLIDNLGALAHAMPAGVVLSVETIPGYLKVLPDILRDCPDVMVTVDTQWVSLEDSWDFVYQIASRVNNLHIQTQVNTTGSGDVQLGRTQYGPYFDAEKVVREFISRGFRGAITLEPQGVSGTTPEQLRQALLLLEKWSL